MDSIWCLPFVLLILHQQLGSTNADPAGGNKFDAMYQFGDSLADTGNLAVILNATSFGCLNPPYGETYFGHPTGRCSDGLLMCDFIAKALGLPFTNPYLDTGADFSHGVNFAIAGATAMDATALQRKNISSFPNSSLSVEMDWFQTHLQSISPSSHGRRNILRRSLIMMGEIGGNDINFVFIQGKSFPLAYSLIPDVIQVIKNAIQETIDEGAVHIVVPGNFPIGCVPVYQTVYATNDTSMYDDLKCLKNFNLLVQFQNRKLIAAITELKQQNPGVIIAYADFYNAYRFLIQNAASLGLEEDQAFNQCCGTLEIGCGVSGAQLCANPKTRISWDGLHPTHQANKYMTQWLLPRIFDN